MKILVVDNDPAIREYLEEVLNLMGHSVIALADGYDAIDYVREHDVNLAYIDVNIPGIDGFETYKKIRQLDPNVSVVMVTGGSVEDLLKKPIEKGIYVGLKKPFQIEQLEEVNTAYEELRGHTEFIYANPYGLNIERLRGVKLLVVDDEPDIAGIIKEHLKMEGLNDIDIAEDGDEAIMKFNEKRYDLVIADIIMPKKSGIEVLRHVKAISEDSQVIIITGNADKDKAITALRLGAYDFIEKPFDLSSLTRIVKRAIEKRLLLEETKKTVE